MNVFIDITSCKTGTFCASHIHNWDDDDENNNWNRFYIFHKSKLNGRNMWPETMNEMPQSNRFFVHDFESVELELCGIDEEIGRGSEAF